MPLLKHMTNCLRTTSVKGVGRVFKANCLGTRLLWGISVAVLVSFSIYQVSDLVIRYLGYTTVSSLMSKSWTDKTMVEDGCLPSLVVCNTNPLTSQMSAYRDNNIPTLDEFYRLLPEEIPCKNCTGRLRHANLAGFFRTQVGYLQYIGLEGAEVVTHEMDFFMLDCYVLVSAGTTVTQSKCTDLVKFTPLVNPFYFRCFKMELLPDVNLNAVGYSIMAFVDNSIDNPNAYFHRRDHYQVAGVRLALVEPQTVTDLYRVSDFIDVGKFAHVKYSVTKRERQPQPYGDCTSTQSSTRKWGAKLGLAIADLGYKYSSDLCAKLCLLYHLEKLCGCFDISLLDSSMNFNVTGKIFCGKYIPNSTIHITRMTCVLNSHRAFGTQCHKRCNLPCKQLVYKTRLTQSTWPLQAMSKSFIQVMGKDHPFLYRIFQKYITELDHQKKGKMETNNITIHNLTSYGEYEIMHFIKHNFLKFEVISPSNTYLLSSDEIKTNLSDLFSSIGGSLNLWSGISIYLVIELLEFFVVAVHECFNSQKDATTKINVKQTGI